MVFPIVPRPNVASLSSSGVAALTGITSYANLSDCNTVVAHVSANGWLYEDSDTLFIGEPTTVPLSQEQYEDIQGNQLEFSSLGGKTQTFLGTTTGVDHLSDAGLIILNNHKLVIDEGFAGHYVGIVDNTNGNPVWNHDSALNLRSKNKSSESKLEPGEYIDIPTGRLNTSLSAYADTTDNLSNGNAHVPGSVSQQVEDYTGNLFNAAFSDIIGICTYKVRQSIYDVNKLDAYPTGHATGSLSQYKIKDATSGGEESWFLETVTDNTLSPYVDVIINDNIHKISWYDNELDPTTRVRVYSNNYGKDWTGKSEEDSRFVDDTESDALSAYTVALSGSGLKHAENLYANGVFKENSPTGGVVGSIPRKIQRVFELADNFELYPIDVVVDGGLSTIFAGSYSETLSAAGGTFDDEKSINLTDEKFYTSKLVTSWDTDQDVRDSWNAVTNEFVTFAESKRKDCLFVSDPLRHIFVQGASKKVLSDKTESFSKHVYWPLRHLYGSVNTSYAAAYGNWVKVYDSRLNKQVWVPFSGLAAGIFADVDAAFHPWFAPAGFTRGVVNGVSDLALYPNQKERDLLYKINLNPIANFPNDGFVVFGQKTLQAKPSAFDRINVRRLFLYLEKATRSATKYFVFEPNSLFTRTQLVNVLTPLFDNAKNTDGLYDHLIICDERNNTPDVIDQNELVVDIYLKPTRSAEFILVNFYATRTSQNFSELVS